MEIRKSLAAMVLASLLLAQAQAGIIPGFGSLTDIPSIEASSGNFASEGAIPKFDKTWIATITCRDSNGGIHAIGSGDPYEIATMVRNAIQTNGWNITPPTEPLVRSDGSWDGGGSLHTPTLTAVCQMLGFESVVSSTCRDLDRESPYDNNPGGKCNFHSPYNNQLYRFTGTFAGSGPACSDMKDNDGDGKIDFGNDPGCTGPNDTDETDPTVPPPPPPPPPHPPGNTECSDRVDNDNDGKIDFTPVFPAETKNQHAAKASEFASVSQGQLHEVGTSPIFLSENAPMTVGGLVLNLAGTAFRFSANGGNFTSQTQNKVAISGPENFDIHFSSPTFGFGFVVYEPSGQPDTGKTGSDPAPFRDSTFTLTFKNGGTVVETMSFNSENDEQRFHSVWLSEAFNVVEVRENGTLTSDPITGTGIENEYFGSFVSTTTPFIPKDPECSSPDDDSEAPPPSLTISKTVQSSVQAGQNVTYSFTVKNTATAVAKNVRIHDVFMDGGNPDTTPPFTYVSSTVACNPHPNYVHDMVCPLGDLAAGQQVSFQMTFATPAQQFCGDSIANKGSIFLDGVQESFKDDTASIKVNCAPIPQCRDSVDNDRDALIDFPNDPGCSSPDDNDETNAPTPECRDGLDNDGDGFIDFPLDPGCTNDDDDDESPVNTPNIQITDTVQDATVSTGDTAVFVLNLKNTGTVAASQTLRVQNTFKNAQGQVLTTPPFTFTENTNASVATCAPHSAQYPHNIVCELAQPLPANGERTFGLRYATNAGQFCGQTLTHTAEVTVFVNQAHQTLTSDTAQITVQCADIPECRDGIDNDGDGASDYPADFSCSGPDDDDETNPKAQCQDGIDNDNDGKIDFPQDLGCSSTQDNDEFNQLSADLSIIKTGPAQITRGSVIKYSVKATNLGPNTAQGVTISDPIPNGLTFNAAQSDSSCIQNGPNILCDNLTLTSGASNTVIIAFNVPTIPNCTTSNIYNTATVSSAASDPNSTNNTSQTIVTTANCPTNPPQCSDGVDNDGDGLIDYPLDPGCSSDQDNDETNQQTTLTVNKSAPATVQAGQNITYTFTVKNTGNTTALNVRAHDKFRDANGIDTTPPFTYVSSSVPCAPHQTSTHALVCPLGDLAAGQQVTFSVTFKAPQGQYCGQSITNQADLFTGSVQQSVGTDTATVAVQCSALPQCSDTIDNDGDGKIDFPLDPGCSSSTDNDETDTQNTADVSLVKSGAQFVQRGSVMLYTLTATNAGPNTATNVIIQDTIPTGLVFNAAQSSNSCAQNGLNVLCNNITLTSGQSHTVSIAFNVPSTLACDSVVQNVANVATSSFDPNSANNFSQTVSTVVKCPNPILVLNKTDGKTQAAPGENLTYSITLQNVSTVATIGLTVEDALPDNTTFVSATNGGQLLGDIIKWNGIIVPANSTVTLTLVVRVHDAATNGLVIRNIVRVGTLSAEDTTAIVTSTPTADLSIVKTGATASVIRGNNVVYTIVVTNNGPAQATGVTVTDTIPLGLAYVSVSGAVCQLALPNATIPTFYGILSCELGTLASGQSKSIQVTLSTSVPTTCSNTTVTNSAAVTSTSTDPVSTNNTDTEQTALTCPPMNADLSIMKSGNISSVIRGENVIYTMTVTNLGFHKAQGTIFRDTFPSDLEYISSSVSPCTVTGNVVECSLNDVEVNAPRTFTLTFKAKTIQSCTQSVTVTNSAAVTTTSTDPIATNNVDTEQTTLTCPTTNTDADLSLIKTGPSTTTYGQTVTYTLTVKNNSTVAATNVVATDTFPSQMTYQAASSSSQCVLTSGTVKCTLASLAANTQTAFTLVFQVGDPPSSCTQTTITNTAVASATNVDPVSGNNSSTVSSTLTCNNGTIDQLSISKTDGRSTVYTQERLRYLITVTNNATTTVTNATVTDSVPSGLSIISVSDGGIISGQQVTWSNQTFTSYQSRTFYIDAEVSSSIANNTVLTNTATVGTRQATDQTTVQTLQSPPNPPPYYPPYNPPYYPPYQPPVQPPYYPPVQPPMYPPISHPKYPGVPPIYIYPETGGEATLYADATETENLTAVANGAEQGSGSAGIFYATLAAMLAIGSAAASKFLLGGGMLLG